MINKLLRYFFRGLLFTAPFFTTVYILYFLFTWLDGLLNIQYPGLGILLIVASVTLLGSMASTLIIKPLYDILDNVFERVPFVSVIYSSIKDLVNAFVGDNRKFKKAVMVTINKDQQIKKLGFITQTDLTKLGMPDQVAVYLPHSYNISGDLFIVPKENVEYLDVPVSDVMKFVVSGGISGIH